MGIHGLGHGKLLCHIEGRDVFYITPPALAQVLFIAKCSHCGPYLLQVARGPDLGLTDSDQHPEGGTCGIETDILG